MYIIIYMFQKKSLFYNLNTVFGRLVMFSVCHININNKSPNKTSLPTISYNLSLQNILHVPCIQGRKFFVRVFNYTVFSMAGFWLK
jgi:hypothetical protein